MRLKILEIPEILKIPGIPEIRCTSPKRVIGPSQENLRSFENRNRIPLLSRVIANVFISKLTKCDVCTFSGHKVAVARRKRFCRSAGVFVPERRGGGRRRCGGGAAAAWSCQSNLIISSSSKARTTRLCKQTRKVSTPANQSAPRPLLALDLHLFSQAIKVPGGPSRTAPKGSGDTNGWQLMISGEQKALISGWYPWYPYPLDALDIRLLDLVETWLFSAVFLVSYSGHCRDLAKVKVYPACIFLTRHRPAMSFGNRKKNILEDLFSLVLSQFKKYHSLENWNLIIYAFPKA